MSKISGVMACLIVIRIATSAHAEVPTVLSVVRPWLAETLELTPEQRAKAILRVARFQREIASVMRQYPTGGQDGEGEAIRRRLEQRIEADRQAAIDEVRQLLTDAQRDKLADAASKVQPTRDVMLKEGKFTELLQPAGVQPLGMNGVKLTKSQYARVRAAVLQAEDDWLADRTEPDQRLKALRQQMDDRLSALLTDEQRTQWQAERDRASATASRRVIFHHILFEAPREKYFVELRQAPKSADIRPVSGLGSQAEFPGDKNQAAPDRLLWHPEDELIGAIAISPDGRLAITVGVTAPRLRKSTEIRLWEVVTGKLLDVVSRGQHQSAAASARFFTSESAEILVSPFYK
jgi:hypothetical protein